MAELNLNIGALGPTISEQVRARGFGTKMPADKLDRMEHSIHLLRIHGILTHAESDRALKRLIKDMRLFAIAAATGQQQSEEA